MGSHGIASHAASSGLMDPPSQQEILALAQQACELAQRSLQHPAVLARNAPLIARLNIALLESHKRTGRMTPADWRRACATQMRLYSQLRPGDVTDVDKWHIAAILADLGGVAADTTVEESA